MSGLEPDYEENEYGNIIRRAPVNYPSRLMNHSPEPEATKEYCPLRALSDNEGMRKKSPENLDRACKETIENTKRANK
ncbi:5f996888-2a20-410b-a260-80800a97afad [Sclerotinia trifoliorum]|uniref:5f996888-2a20-410b-a260-80800a97afad n=1 Tax=Sclerotinia trifoliorum TaxID=28548 RepID=A0A8H2VW05_9HELO|nr:5f996888-2a20-410b-a260-80800a97afad [Sclerotinia trifoliorum]